MEFKSRLEVLNRVLEALRDDRVSICSIYGMGGVGKTTLAKQIIKKVEAGHFFDKIAMVMVSKNPNLEAIQYKIKEQLGLKSERTTIINWLMNNTILLILDDVWWPVDYEAIGIPLSSKRCKIVLISRNQNVCHRMGSQHNFHVNVLEYEEAWVLFRQKAGRIVEDLHIHDMAKKIADECGGLPISIVTIATTLKNNNIDAWTYALHRLQNSKPKVYSQIKLSYDLLQDKEAQSCFLMCCLYPQGYNVPIEDLVLYGKGLQLFDNVDTMTQARGRVESIIHKLKKSYLLLDSEECECVQMHDMVRDVAIIISSIDIKYPYLVKCENVMREWPYIRKNENYSAISFMCDEIKVHPVDLACPKLELLQLSFGYDSAQMPIGIFDGMKKLKVVSLNIPSLCQSLSVLEKLRTLCVIERVPDNKNRRKRIGYLLSNGTGNLEIFSFCTARPYDDFPAEIGKLYNLRFLKFIPGRLKYVPPGVLLRLVKLEELYLPWDFIRWGCKEEGGERINASLHEIEYLQLIALSIGISKGSVFGEKLVHNLTRFKVFIGSHISYNYEFGIGDNSKRLLEVFDVDAYDVTEGANCSLLMKSENLRLKQVRNLKNIITWQPKEENIGFPQWEKIHISDCDELEYLVDTIVAERIPFIYFSQLKSLKLFGLHNLKEIWNSLHFSKVEAACFSNLTQIVIYYCKKLKYVFPLSVATELRQLQSVDIGFCDEMEGIFHGDESDNCNQIASSSKECRSVQLSTKSFPIVNTNSTCIHQKQNSIFGRLFRKLQKYVSDRQVEENLTIDEKEVDDLMMDAIIFPRLKTIELAFMNKLRGFYDGNHALELPSLESLNVYRCNDMEAFSYGSFSAPKLKEIKLNGEWYSTRKDECNYKENGKSHSYCRYCQLTWQEMVHGAPCRRKTY